jgi:hypothetical protein
MIKVANGGSFALPTAIAVRADFSSHELRRRATWVKDAAQARRLLAISAVLDGGGRMAGLTSFNAPGSRSRLQMQLLSVKSYGPPRSLPKTGRLPASKLSRL